MDNKVEKYLKAMRKHTAWDPAKNKHTDTVEHHDDDALRKEMVKMAKDCWSITMTLEQAKVTPFFNFLYIAYGHAKPEELRKLLDDDLKDKREPSHYLSVVDPVPDFIKAAEDSAKKFWELAPGSTEYNINGMILKEFDDDDPHGLGVSATLKANGMPGWNNILHVLDDSLNKVNEIIDEKEDALTLASHLQGELDRLTPLLGEMQQKLSQAATPVKVEASGEIPAGTPVKKKISELFPNIQDEKGNKTKFDNDWEITCWEWEGDHPLVPEADPHYIFRKKELVPVLFAIIMNERAYLQGHTGSGKTTLLEQAAAAMNWPFIRINFDSEITRMDLIGRDTLKTVEGETVSEFVDGILPRAMTQPCIACFDELDFCRPDVSYVMQSALEGNGMRITEDGDRLVTPHPMFRMFGTGNTVGQGDEEGMYQGARPQSIAFLDRFTVWVNVDYLSEKQRRELVSRHYPTLTDDQLNSICLYTNEHLAAFREAKITQPISPRGMLAIAKMAMMLGDVKQAVINTMINRANSGDRTTLNGVVSRVFK